MTWSNVPGLLRSRRAGDIVCVGLVIVAAAFLTSCTQAMLSGLRYNYNRAHDQCAYEPPAQYGECVQAIRSLAQRGADPNEYWASKERRAKEAAQQRERERAEALSRCPSATERVMSATNRGDYRSAIAVLRDSSVCPDQQAIAKTLITEIRKLTPQRVAAYRDDDLAALFWQPIELVQWLDASSRGSFVSDRGVYIVGRVAQQFDDKAVLEVTETVRVVVRLERQRFLQVGEQIFVIGRFAEIRPFTTALGARVDMPVFDLVYGLG